MILSTVSLKGGVGKTTTAINLAVGFASRKIKVTLIDSDANNNSVYWSGLREDDLPPITTVSITSPQALQKNVKQLYNDCDILIIDGTPALSELTSTIILLSDLVIIPILSSPLDIWATNIFLDKFNQAKTLKPEIKAYFLLNQLDPRTNLSHDAIDVIKEQDIPLLNSYLHNRVAYKESLTTGKGVLEYRDEKAKNEIKHLIKEIEKIIKH
ncbi:MAG: ParA family partition ATPase [Cyclobacteriaceae bacterium]